MPTTTGDKISYPFVPGPFTRILKKAVNDSTKNYYLIVEEINRGNAPAIFGEVFQLLDRNTEEDKEEDPSLIVGESSYGINNADIAKEVYGDESHPVKIPSNLFILATMNTADQNVFTLDTAFKRRWRMKNIKNDIDGCKYAKENICGRKVTWAEFAKKINELILECGEGNLSSEDNRLGAYFVQKSELADTSAFAEKVLMYLWNDAFKFDRDKVFKTGYKSVEELIENFENNGFTVFVDALEFDNGLVSPSTSYAETDDEEDDGPSSWKMNYWTKALPKILEATGGESSPYNKISPQDRAGLDGYFYKGAQGVHPFARVSIQKKRCISGLWIDVGNAETNKEIFDFLYSKKDEIESHSSYTIVWDRKESRASSIEMHLNEVDFSIEDNWNSAIEFQAKSLKEIADFIYYPYEKEIKAAIGQ